MVDPPDEIETGRTDLPPSERLHLSSAASRRSKFLRGVLSADDDDVFPANELASTVHSNRTVHQRLFQLSAFELLGSALIFYGRAEGLSSQLFFLSPPNLSASPRTTRDLLLFPWSSLQEVRGISFLVDLVEKRSSRAGSAGPSPASVFPLPYPLDALSNDSVQLQPALQTREPSQKDHKKRGAHRGGETPLAFASPSRSRNAQGGHAYRVCKSSRPSFSFVVGRVDRHCLPLLPLDFGTT